MAPRKRPNNADYEKLQEKLEKLERKYLKLKQKHKGLGLSSDEDSSEEEIEQHPAKKRRTSKKPSMDPLFMLNPDCFEEVLKYLKPKELLDCKLVSKPWQRFIESRTTLMKRTMNKIVLDLTSNKLQDMNIQTLDNILDGERDYKYMRTELVLVQKNFRFSLSSNRAATLVHLELNCVSWANDKFVPEPFEFLVLKKLEINCKANCIHKQIMNLIEASKFPELTHFIMGKLGAETMLENLIENFPKLKVFSLFESQNRRMARQWSLANMKKLKNPPKLEAICVRDYLKYFIEAFKDTLTELSLFEIDNNELAHLLRAFKNLERLSIGYLETRGHIFSPLPRHEKITTLDLGTTTHQPDDPLVHALLRALPSLHRLITSSECHPLNINNDFILFLATNMKNLKSLIFETLATSFTTYLETLRANGNADLNTGFEILALRRYQDFNWRHFG